MKRRDRQQALSALSRGHGLRRAIERNNRVATIVLDIVADVFGEIERLTDCAAALVNDPAFGLLSPEVRERFGGDEALAVKKAKIEESKQAVAEAMRCFREE